MAAQSGLNEALLDAKLAELEKARTWSPRLISKLETLLRSNEPFALHRINPLQFATDRGLEDGEALDLFLHAAKVGLFRLEWRMLCPGCSDTMVSIGALSLLESKCFCSLCHVTHTGAMDDLVQVSFSVSPEVRREGFHDPLSLSVEDYTFRYRFDSAAISTAAGGIREVDLMRSISRGLTWLEAGETRTLEFEAVDGFYVVAHDLVHGQGFPVTVAGGETKEPQTVTVRLTSDGWQGVPAKLQPGHVRIVATNGLDTKGTFMVGLVPNVVSEHREPLVFPRALTGNQLLNSQTFRTLYRAETIRSSEGIGVRDLTLVFTDLKGSTAMYDRVGDLRAFALVQQHFEHIGRAVQANRGAVVKTIGDAVMASFNTPIDALKASLAMLAEIERFNHTEGQKEIVLKIGIHRGASIAVTQNERLDYFGQTVNTAARVQGLADADEICLTRDVMEFPGVRALAEPFGAKEELASLKGIGKPVPIYRLAVPQAGA